jgi:hypothetical protein
MCQFELSNDRMSKHLTLNAIHPSFARFTPTCYLSHTHSQCSCTLSPNVQICLHSLFVIFLLVLRTVPKFIVTASSYTNSSSSSSSPFYYLTIMKLTQVFPDIFILFISLAAAQLITPRGLLDSLPNLFAPAPSASAAATTPPP